MNAVEFVKVMGIDATKAFVRTGNINPDKIGDLKQIVEAFELVESYGGVTEASFYVFEETGEDCYYNKALEKAINLVEQCQ